MESFSISFVFTLLTKTDNFQFSLVVECSFHGFIDAPRNSHDYRNNFSDLRVMPCHYCSWSQRSSLGIIIDEEETDFDKFDPVPEYGDDKCDPIEAGDDVTLDDDNNDNNEHLAPTQQLLPAVDTFIASIPSGIV